MNTTPQREPIYDWVTRIMDQYDRAGVTSALRAALNEAADSFKNAGLSVDAEDCEQAINESLSGGNPGEPKACTPAEERGIAGATGAGQLPATTAETRDSAERRSPDGTERTPSLDESNRHFERGCLHFERGCFVIMELMQAYERDALKAENERLRASHEPLTDHMAALIDSAYYEGAKLALIKADESIQVAREWLAGGCNGRRQAALAILRHAPPPPDVQRDARDAEAGRKLWAYLVKQGRPWEEDQDEYAAMGLLVPHDMTAEDSGPECLNCMGDCETCYRPSTTLLVESPTPSQTKGAES